MPLYIVIYDPFKLYPLTTLNTAYIYIYIYILISLVLFLLAKQIQVYFICNQLFIENW